MSISFPESAEKDDKGKNRLGDRPQDRRGSARASFTPWAYRALSSSGLNTDSRDEDALRRNRQPSITPGRRWWLRARWEAAPRAWQCGDQSSLAGSQTLLVLCLTFCPPKRGERARASANRPAEHSSSLSPTLLPPLRTLFTPHTSPTPSRQPQNASHPGAWQDLVLCRAYHCRFRQAPFALTLLLDGLSCSKPRATSPSWTSALRLAFCRMLSCLCDNTIRESTGSPTPSILARTIHLMPVAGNELCGRLYNAASLSPQRIV